MGWLPLCSLIQLFISIVDILQWLKKAQAGRPARILQKVGWKTRSWDLVSTLASPGNFDQMSQQCLNFFHSGMKNINCSLIDPHQKHLTRLFHLIQNLTWWGWRGRGWQGGRWRRQGCSPSPWWPLPQSGWAPRCGKWRKKTNKFWLAPQSFNRHCSNSHRLAS